MSDDKLSVVWVSGPAGVERVETRKAAHFTEASLHQRARLALTGLDQIFERFGWQKNAYEGSIARLFCYNRQMVEFKIIESGKVAYVTSYPGYQYVAGKDSDKHKQVNAKVSYLGDSLPNRFTVMVTITNSERYSKTQYLEVSNERGDPAITLVKDMLLTLRSVFGPDAFKIGAQYTPAEDMWIEEVNNQAGLLTSSESSSREPDRLLT